MARLKTTLARALILYLALQPLLGAAAELRAEPQTIDTPRPFDPPRPTDPPTPPHRQPAPRGSAPFTAVAEPLTVRSLNGFRTDAILGYYSHAGHVHAGGTITVDSPWGERLDIRFWLTPHGFSLEYDDDLVVRYRFDDEGTLQEIWAESPKREARMAVGNRAELAAQGLLEFTSFDLSAYEVIEESLRTKHSDAFLDGIREAEGAIEASCATSLILCGACIVAWANTVSALATACVVGGVPTWGFPCFMAILAHEAAGYGCAVTCANMVRDCTPDGPPPEPIPDGCEP